MERTAPGHPTAAIPATTRPALLGSATLGKIDRVKTQKNCMSGPKDLVTRGVFYKEVMHQRDSWGGSGGF
jgi:hypothetical protein